MQRHIHIWLFMIATIFMVVQVSYAQTTPPGHELWPMDSVVNGSVHRYTVQGDVNYDTPSNFVWGVNGGTLYFDENATLVAGTGKLDTVPGNAQNRTTMWVKWDEFNTALDTGYVFLFEISSDGCQYEVVDARRYTGMRIKVSAPPKVRFISNLTSLCSYDSDTMVIVQIDGMPPFDLKYRIDGVESTMHIEPSDLFDWDNDGKVDNIAFAVTGVNGATQVSSKFFELLEASSGGVPGEVLTNYNTHTLNIYVAPPALVITEYYTEVTRGQKHTYTLSDAGLDPDEILWTLLTENNYYVNDTISANWPLLLDYDAGKYRFEVNYKDINGCYSPFDTLGIEIFDRPTIRFVTADNDGNCSAVENILGAQYQYLADMQFDFELEYYGATHYDFTWCVKDFNGVKVIGDQTETHVTIRDFIIQIQHVFENTELPAENRYWTVEIVSAETYEGVDVEIIDGGGVRRIGIHPKPEIMEDIDFAN